MGLEHWVWLGLALPPGSAKLDAVLRRFPDPEEFFEAGEGGFAEVPELDHADAIRIRALTLDPAKAAIERAHDLGGTVLCRTDADYPVRLAGIAAAPPALYVLGSLKGLNKAVTVAMVGSRACSDYGRRAAGQIADGLAKKGIVIISGLAAGIDAVCHTACLDAGGRTVAVQGCGIGALYPPENAALKERITGQGAVISEFPPDAKPQSSFFPLRNRIVSGLSYGVLVAEATIKSGTMITAACALEQGRDIFAVPGDIFKPGSQGGLTLLKQGAVPVSCAADVLAVFAKRYPNKVRSTAPEEQEGARAPIIRREPPGELSQNARLIYDILERRAKYTDELCAASGLSAAEAAAALTELEIFGLAEHLPGRRFRLG